MRLPIAPETPYVATAVHVTGQSTRGQGPVFLTAQDIRRPELRVEYLTLVHSLQKEHRDDVGLVVRHERFVITRIISVNAINRDARNPVWIILRFADGGVKLNSQQVVGVHAFDAVCNGENHSILLLRSPVKIVPQVPDYVR